MGIAIARRRGSTRAGACRDRLRLYYASDVHGAERCWMKFLGAGEFYNASAVIMGGDIAGKAIVPIELVGDCAFHAEFMGQTHAGATKEEFEQLAEAIRYNGFYPYPARRGELDRYRSDPLERDALFERVMVDEARRWMALGDERVARTGIPVYVMAGNDDPWSFDAVLHDARHVISAEDAIVRIGDHEMVSSSYTNPTPWKSPRELPDPQLYQRLKALTETLEAPERAIFNLHAPPFDSGLDLAYEVSDDVSLVTKGGRPVLKAVGSEAVRQIIEEYQPLLALHGHIHESRGAVRIGRTLCINPGSRYNTGRIDGVLVTLTPEKVVGHQFVVG
jgi:uncharacterized protein